MARRVGWNVDATLRPDKLDSKCKETLRLTLCVSVLDANVPSFDPSEGRKTLSKGVYLSPDGSVGFARLKAYAGNFSDCCSRAQRAATLPHRQEG